MDVYIWGSDRRDASGHRSPHSIIRDGAILTFADNPTDFDILINKDLARVRFEPAVDTAGTRLEYVVTPGTQGSMSNPPTVTVRLFNLATGTVFAPGTVFADGPLRLGTIGGMAVWLCFEVTRVVANPPMYRITYTLWDGSAPNVPQQLLPPQGPANG
jgi:hypothetical protein